jgi:hypothetical protein
MATPWRDVTFALAFSGCGHQNASGDGVSGIETVCGGVRGMNREETLALYARGKEAWNAWAEDMLAKRKALEEAGTWEVENNLGSLELQNEATKAWAAVATADFSSAEVPHSFDDAVCAATIRVRTQRQTG